MLRVVLVLLGLAIYIWFIVDVLRTPGPTTRALPKAVWLLIVVLLPLIGGLIWMLAGRPRQDRPRRGGLRRRRPVAPDDDPTFLRQLGDDAWAEKMRRRREEGGEAPA